jgi:hypothetical protein
LTTFAAYKRYREELALIESAQRTLSPLADAKSSFYGLPPTDFVDSLRELRDEVEQRAYLAIVAEAEAVLQVDFRLRATRRRSTPLQHIAKRTVRRESRQDGVRITIEDILDAWKGHAGAKSVPISEFRQLLPHRHWLAHGRYFIDRSGVPGDPGYAVERTGACLTELNRLDPNFPLR